MKESNPSLIPQFLDVSQLRMRHNKKQENLGMQSCVGVMINDGLSMSMLPDGSIAMTTRPQREPDAEMIIVLTKGNPPTSQVLSSVKRSLVNVTAQTRMIGFGIAADDWNDYNIRAVIDSLLFLDFPEFFPTQNLFPESEGFINLMPSQGGYVVDYYRDTPRMAMVAEPDRLAFGVIHRMANQ